MKEKRTQSLKKNVLYNMIYQVIVIITPLVTSPYISRVLKPEGIGAFSYSQSVANYFFLFSMLGVNNYGTRMIAQNRESRNRISETFWQIYYMQAFQATIFLSLYVVFCFSFVDSDLRMIFLIQGLQIFSVYFDVNWFAFGCEQFKLTTIRNIVVKFFSVCAIFLFVKHENDLWKYATIVSLGTIFGLLAVWPLICSQTDFQLPNFRKIKKHIKPNLILFVPYIASSIFQYMDKIMLGFMSDVSSVGFYSYAENILNVPLSLTTAIGTVFMPRVSNLYVGGKLESAENLLYKVIHYLTILNIALCCGIIAVAPIFVPLYLGEEYFITGELLQILALVVPISGAAAVLRMIYLIPYGKDKIYASAVVAGAIINSVGNAITIPFLGAVGACIMTVCANAGVLLVQVIFTRKEKPYLAWIKREIPFLILGIAMIQIVRLVMKNFENDITALIMGMAAGGIFYLAVSGVVLQHIEKDNFILEAIEKCRKVLQFF